MDTDEPRSGQSQNRPSALRTIDMTEREKQAVERVRRARIKAPESVILAFLRSTGGPEGILMAKLCDIRAIANAF